MSTLSKGKTSTSILLGDTVKEDRDCLNEERNEEDAVLDSAGVS